MNVNIYILAPRESAQERSLLGFCATENGKGGIVRFKAEDEQQATSKNRPQVINEKASHIVARTAILVDFKPTTSILYVRFGFGAKPVQQLPIKLYVYYTTSERWDTRCGTSNRKH